MSGEVIFQLVLFTAVNDLGSGILPNPFNFHAVIQMDMAMQQIFGMVLVDEFQERFKATVGSIIPVAYTQGCCVGQHNIHTAHHLDGSFHLLDPFLHLPFGVLMLSPAIGLTATQAQDPQALIDHQLILDAVAALRGLIIIGAIMVAVDIHEWTPCHGHDKAQVIALEIATGENQVIDLQPAGNIVVPQGGAFFICNNQYLHFLPASFKLWDTPKISTIGRAMGWISSYLGNPPTTFSQSQSICISSAGVKILVPSLRTLPC